MSLYITPGGRIYHAGIGRFLQRDPETKPGGNPYIYANSSPVVFSDPRGTTVVPIVVARPPDPEIPPEPGSSKKRKGYLRKTGTLQTVVNGCDAGHIVFSNPDPMPKGGWDNRVSDVATKAFQRLSEPYTIEYIIQGEFCVRFCPTTETTQVLVVDITFWEYDQTPNPEDLMFTESLSVVVPIGTDNIYVRTPEYVFDPEEYERPRLLSPLPPPNLARHTYPHYRSEWDLGQFGATVKVRVPFTYESGPSAARKLIVSYW